MCSPPLPSSPSSLPWRSAAENPTHHHRSLTVGCCGPSSRPAGGQRGRRSLTIGCCGPSSRPAGGRRERRWTDKQGRLLDLGPPPLLSLPRPISLGPSLWRAAAAGRQERLEHRCWPWINIYCHIQPQ